MKRIILSGGGTGGHIYPAITIAREILKIEEAEKAGIKTIVLADDMRGAVEKGKSIACSGDVVLLSPACSSFDMYANYEARGFDFKKIVNRLK